MAIKAESNGLRYLCPKLMIKISSGEEVPIRYMQTFELHMDGPKILLTVGTVDSAAAEVLYRLYRNQQVFQLTAVLLNTCSSLFVKISAGQIRSNPGELGQYEFTFEEI